MTTPFRAAMILTNSSTSLAHRDTMAWASRCASLGSPRSSSAILSARLLAESEYAAYGRPTLDLNFAADGLFVHRLGVSPGFTRASTGAVMGSNALIQTAAINAPRLLYDPITLDCRGLLLELQRTNLALRSEDLANVWTKSGTTVDANAATAPDGNSTADKLVEDSSTGWHRAYQGVTAANGVYTYSVYLKAAGRTKVLISMSDFSTGDASVNIDLSAGTMSAGNFSIGGSWTSGSYQIESVGSGWYRCQITATKGAGSNIGCMIFLLNSSSADSYAGNGSSGVYVWGAQLEAGAFATAYIPTTTAAVTRSADVCSITGTDYSNLFNATEGTLVIEAQSIAAGARYSGFAALSNGTNQNRVYVGPYGGSTDTEYIIASASALSYSASQSGASNAIRKTALAYKLNDCRGALNGSLTAVDDGASALPVGMDRFCLGGGMSTGDATEAMLIRRVRYYASRLSDARLQQLTA